MSWARQHSPVELGAFDQGVGLSVLDEAAAGGAAEALGVELVLGRLHHRTGDDLQEPGGGQRGAPGQGGAPPLAQSASILGRANHYREKNIEVEHDKLNPPVSEVRILNKEPFRLRRHFAWELEPGDLRIRFTNVSKCFGSIQHRDPPCPREPQIPPSAIPFRINIHLSILRDTVHWLSSALLKTPF